jgi:hypothetical protein
METYAVIIRTHDKRVLTLASFAQTDIWKSTKYLKSCNEPVSYFDKKTANYAKGKYAPTNGEVISKTDFENEHPSTT